MSELLLTTSLLQPAKLFPNKTAILCDDIRYTYSELLGRVCRLANGLTGLSLAKGDRFGALMLNCHRYLELYYASAFAGLVITPLNTRLAPAELTYMLNETASLVLVVDDACLPLLEAMKGQLTTVREFIYAGNGRTPEGMISYEELIDGSPATEPDVTLHENDLFAIFYTGGTTGLPKGAMLSHRNLTCNSYHLLGLGIFRHDDTHLHTAPMFHTADASSVFPLAWLGGSHTFLKTWDTKAALEAIQRFRVTCTLWVPTMINAVINCPDIVAYDLSSLRQVTYGASPIPIEVLRKAMGLLPIRFLQGYGMTEASPGITFLSHEDHVLDGPPEKVRRLASCGREYFNVQIRIVDENGDDLPAGAVGEVIIKGPNIMQGYWNKPEETAQALRDGWLHTGDMGFFDEERYLFLVDRKKEMIVSGGENVYSTEVENAIYTHPAVLEAAVIGVPDERWGEAVKAVVVVRPGQTLTADELIRHCRSQIAGYKTPKSVDFVVALPKSGPGKILKRELREQYWAGHNRHIH